jgi:putative transposase
LYKKENDSKVKERLLLLIIKIRDYGQIPFHVVKEMHRSNRWASD